MRWGQCDNLTQQALTNSSNLGFHPYEVGKWVATIGQVVLRLLFEKIADTWSTGIYATSEEELARLLSVANFEPISNLQTISEVTEHVLF